MYEYQARGMARGAGRLVSWDDAYFFQDEGLRFEPSKYTGAVLL